MNSRQKRKMAYRAKDEKEATPRNLYLIHKVAECQMNVNDKRQPQNGKRIDILCNAIRNSKIASRSKFTKKYADKSQKL